MVTDTGLVLCILKCLFSLYENYLFSKEFFFFKFLYRFFFYVYSFDKMISVFIHIEKLEMGYFLF